jgi:5-methyltetrahydropteroyltriglutamate--homocysteine methyltransferase
MKRRIERILTIHTGSLPRPSDLLTLIQATEGGGGNMAAFEARVRPAVAEIVSKQVEAGVDIVNDREMDKPSYATYAKDRLTGFAETSEAELSRLPGMLPWPQGGARRGSHGARPVTAR